MKEEAIFIQALYRLGYLELGFELVRFFFNLRDFKVEIECIRSLRLSVSEVWSSALAYPCKEIAGKTKSHHRRKRVYFLSSQQQNCEKRVKNMPDFHILLRFSAV